MSKFGSFPPSLGKLELFHFDSSDMSDKRDLARFFQILMLQFILLKDRLIRGSDKITHMFGLGAGILFRVKMEQVNCMKLIGDSSQVKSNCLVCSAGMSQIVKRLQQQQVKSKSKAE